MFKCGFAKQDSSITIIDPFLLIQLVSKSAYLFSVSFPPNISVKGTTAANSHLTFGRLEFEMLNNLGPVKHSSNFCLNIDVTIHTIKAFVITATQDCIKFCLKAIYFAV